MTTNQLKVWARAAPSQLQPDPAVQGFLSSAHAHIAYATRVEQGNDCPGYGILSQHAQQISVVAYGLSTLKKRYAKSFVDTSSTVFVSDDLITKIALEESSTRGIAKGLEPLIMLQQMRILMNHVGRLTVLSDGTTIPEDIAQIAGETSAYCKLRAGFPDTRWVPCISEDIAASTLSELRIQYWATKAEETIARHLLFACARVRNDLSRNASEKKVLLSALESLNMVPKLCVHNVCRDPDFALVAIADQERADLLRATRRISRLESKPQSPTDFHGSTVGTQIPAVDKPLRL